MKALNATNAIRHQLPNGLTVVLQPNARVEGRRVPGLGGTSALPTSRQSSPGIAHVFEHMLFKGTARRGVGQIAQEVEARGRRDQRLDQLRPDRLPPGAGQPLLRHRPRHPGRRAPQLVVRSGRARARAEGGARRGQAGRGQPEPGGHPGAVRHRLRQASVSPAGDRLHQDGQVVHPRAAARLLPPLLRGQQHHPRGGRRLRHRAGARRRSPRPSRKAPSRPLPRNRDRAQGAGAEGARARW